MSKFTYFTDDTRVDYRPLLKMKINATGVVYRLYGKAKSDSDRRVAVIKDGDSYTVLYQKRQLRNKYGAVSMQKTWVPYPSATRVKLGTAAQKYADETSRNC